MKRGLIGLLLLVGLVWAKSGLDYARDLLGMERYQKYQKFVNSIVSPTDNLLQVVQKLKQNGLLEMLDHPATIYPVFTFNDNNPRKDTFILYNVLHSIGYSFYYPSYISRNLNNYTLQMEIKALQQIDPLAFINEMERWGCRVTDIKKYQNYLFIMECGPIQIPDAIPLNQLVGGKGVQNESGVYWIAIPPNVTPIIKIDSPVGNRWHPYLAFFDSQLNLLDLRRIDLPQRSVTLQPPAGTRYIKIADMFAPVNIKKGFLIEANYTIDSNSTAPTTEWGADQNDSEKGQDE